ncbi:MAG: hypothetical protein IJD83_06320 [Clostridia bacterium]|nr:hypothetical protein [Clostridia bacterium]
MKNRIYDNGIYRDMTAEEIQSSADAPEMEAEVSPEERIEALEAAVLELAEVVLNG